MDASFMQTYAEWIEHVSPQDKNELERLAANKEQLADAFSSDLHFGTGGLRAKMGLGPNRLNIYTVARATQGVANWVKAQPQALQGRCSVVLARDTRLHGEELLQAAACVLAANGICAVVISESAPTPLLAFATRTLGAIAGIVLTASHNPREYNGYKVYDALGCQAATRLAKEIQVEINKVHIFTDVQSLSWEEGLAGGLIQMAPTSLFNDYVDAVIATRQGIDCANLHVAYSALNGTGAKLVPWALRRVGVAQLDCVAAQMEPDGNFTSCPKPNPEEPAAMKELLKLAKDTGAEIALATDPDADRLGVAVEHNHEFVLLSGNDIGVLLMDWICALSVAAGIDLSHKVCVTTIVSAPMADAVAQKWGVELRRTLTGFKYTGEQMELLEQEGRAGDFLFGLEESLGYLGGSYIRDKDGTEAAVLVCEMAAYFKAQGKDLVQALYALKQDIGFFAAKQVAVWDDAPGGKERIEATMSRLRAGVPVELEPFGVTQCIDYADEAAMPVINPLAGEVTQTLPVANVLEWRFKSGAKLIVRPSGTEPKIKAYLSTVASTEEKAQAELFKLESVVRELLS